MRNLLLLILLFLSAGVLKAQNEGLAMLKGAQNNVYSLKQVKKGFLPQIVVKNPEIYILDSFEIVYLTSAAGFIKEHSVFTAYSFQQEYLLKNSFVNQVVEYRAYLLNKRTNEMLETIVAKIVLK